MGDVDSPKRWILNVMSWREGRGFAPLLHAPWPSVATCHRDIPTLYCVGFLSTLSCALLRDGVLL